MSNRSQLIHYSIRLSRIKNRICCSFCDLSLLPKEYEKHCTEFHNLDARLCCVWCGGAVSWSQRRKNRHVDHLVACYRKFIAPRPSAPYLPLPNPSAFVKFDVTPLCAAKNFFGRTRISGLIDEAYESIFEPSEEFWGEFSIFSSPTLNLAAACILKYLETCEEWSWHHIMVHGVAFNSFFSVMEKWRGETVLLPFWCWCDSGKYELDIHRQHRHMIAASPDKKFIPNVWRRIKIAREDRPKNQYQSISFTGIKSPLHLLNTIRYLSRRKSQCRISGNAREDQNHFCINKVAPLLFRWPLACVWEEGLMQLIEMRSRQDSFEKLAPHMIKSDGKWRIRINDLTNIPQNLILPVARNLRPTDKVTGQFLYLNKNRKLYFEEDTSLCSLNDDEWMKLQAESGNIFCRIVGRELFTPVPWKLRALNMIVPLMKRVHYLEKDVEEKCIALENEWKRKDQPGELEECSVKRRKSI